MSDSKGNFFDGAKTDSETLSIVSLEWQECRETIRGFDTILTHIRSYSILATIALLSGGVYFSVSPDTRLRGILIEFLALALILTEYYLERHYESYLVTTVARAKALERWIQESHPDVNAISAKIDCDLRSDMISTLISYYATQKAGFIKANAHELLYYLLAGVDAGALLLTSFQATEVPSNLFYSLLTATIIIGCVSFWRIRNGWLRRKEHFG